MSTEPMQDLARMVRKLGITEAVHFTTDGGMLGIARHGSVLSRKRLPEALHLKHVYEPNAKIRRDASHLDYVNLSIDRINDSFFRVSERWQSEKPDLYWCLLGFSPEILSHDGVLFATTNNMYTGVVRNSGVEGLGELYKSQITRWPGNIVRREQSALSSWPTCRQAEVLYPGDLSLALLRTVYVRQHEHADQVFGWLKTFNRAHGIKIVVDSGKFL